MDNFLVAILGTFFGFLALAFGLLFPVYRFLTREEKAAEAWTPDALARRQRRDEPAGDGAAADRLPRPGDVPRPPAPS